MRTWTKADYAMWSTLYAEASRLTQLERDVRWAQWDAKRQARENQVAFRRYARKRGAMAALWATTMHDPQFGRMGAADARRIYTLASDAAHHAFAAHPELRT